MVSNKAEEKDGTFNSNFLALKGRQPRAHRIMDTAIPNPINVVTGTIGDDIHSFGIKVINHALQNAGFKVISLGIQTPQEDFINAVIESASKAILVSSMSGHARLLCEGLRGRCIEAGLNDIVLYVGGTLSTGDVPWPELEKIFLDMGYTRAFRPTTMPGEIIRTLKADLALWP